MTATSINLGAEGRSEDGMRRELAGSITAAIKGGHMVTAARLLNQSNGAAESGVEFRQGIGRLSMLDRASGETLMNINRMSDGELFIVAINHDGQTARRTVESDHINVGHEALKGRENVLGDMLLSLKDIGTGGSTRDVVAEEIRAALGDHGVKGATPATAPRSTL